jgi:hypothetical protein
MATLDDILSAQKNGVIAINNVATLNRRNQGNATSLTVTGNTLVVTGAGYLCRYAVVVAGSGAGTINDANTVANASSSNALCATIATVGVYEVGAVFNSGLVIKPGSGQSINITYYI